jgi:hypothetical protein
MGSKLLKQLIQHIIKEAMAETITKMTDNQGFKALFGRDQARRAEEEELGYDITPHLAKGTLDIKK